jgi:predicted HTH domain antitoxin
VGNKVGTSGYSSDEFGEVEKNVFGMTNSQLQELNSKRPEHRQAIRRLLMKNIVSLNDALELNDKELSQFKEV